MPKFRLNISVKRKGAVFKAAESKAAATRMVTKLNDDMAQEAVDRVRAILKRVLRNPTGYYERHIQVDRKTTYRGVSDGNVIYGPWLEGTSSRNKTTRFKGYRMFRQTQQEMAKRKKEFGDKAVKQYIKEMNR